MTRRNTVIYELKPAWYRIASLDLPPEAFFDRVKVVLQVLQLRLLQIVAQINGTLGDHPFDEQGNAVARLDDEALPVLRGDPAYAASRGITSGTLLWATDVPLTEDAFRSGAKNAAAVNFLRWQDIELGPVRK
jgi:hypothetical protein